MAKKINVYGQTDFYNKDGFLDSMCDGFGYRDEYGNITWYDGYKGWSDEFTRTTIYPANDNGEITSMFPIARL